MPLFIQWSPQAWLSLADGIQDYAGLHGAPTPQKVYVHALTLKTCKGDFIWETIFTDVIKDLEKHHPGFRPESNDRYPYKRKAGDLRFRHTREKAM